MSRAARMLAVMTMASRFAGLARDATVSAVFGTGPAADAFFVAFRIPNLFRRVVAEGATSAAFVPVFTDAFAKGGKDEVLRAAGAVGGATVLVLLALTGAGMAGAGYLAAVFAPGFAGDPAKQALTAALTMGTFPYLLLVGTAAWEMGVHHTLRRFALPAVGPVLMNLAIIVCALLVSPHLAQPAWGLVAGVLLGGLAQVGVQLPSLWRAGLRPAMLLRVAHPAVARCGRLMTSALAGGSVYQVNVLLATVLASLLPAGTVSYLWYADRVFEFPLGIVAVAVGTAALPSLAAQASASHYEGMGETVVHAMSLTIAFCLPAAVGLLLLSHDITALLFERGSFGGNDTVMTAWALTASVPGLLGVALVRVLTSAFFALERGRVPVVTGAVTTVLALLLSIALMGPIDPHATWWGGAAVAAAGRVIGVVDLRHAGLSLATGLASTCNALMLFVALRRALPAMPLATLARSVLLHLGAAIAMSAVVISWTALAGSWTFHGALALRVAGAVALGGAAYFAVAAAAGSVEVLEVLGSLDRRAGRESGS